MMKTQLAVAVFTLTLGGATAAVADAPDARAQAFADAFRQMQTLSSTSPYTFKSAPMFGASAQDAVADESFSQRFSDMQAASSNSSQWHEATATLSAQAADPSRGEPFAQRFAEMQAASSNSGNWSFHRGADVLASRSNSTLVVAQPATQPPFARLSSWLAVP